MCVEHLSTEPMVSTLCALSQHSQHSYGRDLFYNRKWRRRGVKLPKSLRHKFVSRVWSFIHWELSQFIQFIFSLVSVNHSLKNYIFFILKNQILFIIYVLRVEKVPFYSRHGGKVTLLQEARELLRKQFGVFWLSTH